MSIADMRIIIKNCNTSSVLLHFLQHESSMISLRSGLYHYRLYNQQFFRQGINIHESRLKPLTEPANSLKIDYRIINKFIFYVLSFFMGNLILFFLFYPLGSTRNMHIYSILVAFFIKKDKKIMNRIHHPLSIKNNKPIIGFYKGLQHYSL